LLVFIVRWLITYHTQPGPPPLAQMVYMMGMMGQDHFAVIILSVLFNFLVNPLSGLFDSCSLTRVPKTKSPGCFPGLLLNGIMWNPRQHRSTPFAGGCMMMQMMDCINHCLRFCVGKC